MTHMIRVWDLPTRVFHWGLVACVVGLAITGYTGGAGMDWHARIGYATLTLLLFRIVWGFVGGRWSRFASFVAGPSQVAAYLRGSGHPRGGPGHNPLGALSVVAMLLFLLVQVATGLIGDDETAFTGPLNRFVSSASGLAATWYHKRIGQWVIVALVVLHVGAVLFYLWKKGENLVPAMLHGDKAVPVPAGPSRDDAKSRAAAVAVLLVCAAVVTGVVRLGG